MATAALSELDVGAAAIVAAVVGDGPVMVRLLEMGFVPGTPVQLVKAAPLGDPLQFRVRGYHISLRRSEAAMIRVEPS